MKLNLTPDNMPYTMVVDNDTNWVNLTVVLDDTSDYLRITGRLIPVAFPDSAPCYRHKQVTIAVSPDTILSQLHINHLSPAVTL